MWTGSARDFAAAPELSQLDELTTAPGTLEVFLRIPTAQSFPGSLGQGPDGERIRRLAARSASQPPEGMLLLAEVSGNPVAAIRVFDGHAVSDPERSTFALRMGLHLLRLPVCLFLAVYGV